MLALMVIVAFVETTFTALFYRFASILAGLKDLASLPVARFFVVGDGVSGRTLA